jgi:hypothetical protein
MSSVRLNVISLVDAALSPTFAILAVTFVDISG